MTELSGTLDGVGLPAIVRFLTGLKKTGCLHVTHGDWRGEVLFEDGRVIGASLGSRSGLSALDALVQALPNGAFEFDAAGRPRTGPTIQVSQEVFEAHLSELASGRAASILRLPPVDAVPALLADDDTRSGEEQLSLDRGMLQTLLAVDGQRTVRAIVAQRGTFDALWQLGRLMAAGLVGLPGASASREAAGLGPTADHAAALGAPSPDRADAPSRSRVATAEFGPGSPAADDPVSIQSGGAGPGSRSLDDVSGPGSAVAAGADVPSGSSGAADFESGRAFRAEVGYTPRPGPDVTPIVRPFAQAGPEPSSPSRVACPKLGFEDDPSTSFGRPTRLHRCFAVGRPLPLSMDQQRELCLDEQFATCPRLTMSGGAPAAQVPAPAAEANQAAADDPRIVRWPVTGRARPAAGTGPTAPEHPLGSEARTAPAAAERPALAGTRPAPTMAGRAAAGLPRPASTTSERAAPDLPCPASTTAEPAMRGDARRGTTTERAASGPGRPAWRNADGAAGAGRPAWGVAQRVGSSDAAAGGPEPPATRPGQSAPREAGLARPTPLRSRMAERTPAGESASGVLERSPASPGDPSQPEPEAATQRASAVPGERRFPGLPLPLVGAAAVALLVLAAIGYFVAPRLAPLLADDTLDPARLPNTSAVAAGTPVAQLAVARATAAAGAPEEPAPTPGSARATTSGAASADSPTQPQPKPAVTPATASGQSSAQPQPTSAPSAILLDERFGSATTGWPTTGQGTAWLSDDGYQVATRRAGQFVAVSAPLVQVPSDVVVSATFHKVGGPAGGGYGIIVRDQGPAAQDGVGQAGRYYVLEVGDKGEAGIWRHETDHWVDLLPWQRADAVKPGTASNELTVRAIGNVLSLTVNGVEVGARTDASYPGGRVGIFVGGDGNQVALERFTVQTP